jgi:multiple sugar transport system ATP-binding protein
LALDAGHADDEVAQQLAGADKAHVIARLNPRTQVGNGEPIELEIDTRRLHFFDPDDGSAIYEEPPTTPQPQAVTTTSNDS